MILTSYTQVFLVGVCGGCLLELLHWHALRKDGAWPAYSRSVGYWVLIALMALAGGGLALLYFGARAEALVALHVGLSAPLILQKLATTAFEPKGARSTHLGFWRFLHW